MMEFHIARKTRDLFQVSDALFNFVGNVIFADLASCRQLAFRMTEVRASSPEPSPSIRGPSLLWASSTRSAT